jgi:four helix bundle protein
MATNVGLRALEHAENLAIICRRVIRQFPPEEFRLADQLRRAADSAALNISEGSSRTSYREYRRFLDTARTSLKEVGTALRIGHGSGLIDEGLYQEAIACLDEASRTLYGLIRAVDERIKNNEKRPHSRPVGEVRPPPIPPPPVE